MNSKIILNISLIILIFITITNCSSPSILDSPEEDAIASESGDNDSDVNSDFENDSDNVNGDSSDTIDENYKYQVSGNQIYHNGERINLFGINWFGFETNNHVFHGLWQESYVDLIDIMEDLNFNAIRIPVCPDTLQGVSTSSINTYENPTLDGLNALEVLDLMLDEFDDREIYILLDIHRIECDIITELWYNNNYSEQDWIDDLVFMANRYKNLEYFLGIDLFNEPHGQAAWGTGDEATDWKMAVEEASQEILAVNNDILIFAEGIQENSLCSSTEDEHWWGGNIEPQECYAINIDTTKLVLSPHVYGPDVYWQSYFSDPSFPNNMPAIWDTHFGSLASDVPVILGEFGGKYGEGHAEDITWQNAFIDYLIDKDMCSFFYWCLNPNSGDTGGILDDDWQTVEEAKYQNLCRLMEHCDPSVSCN